MTNNIENRRDLGSNGDINIALDSRVKLQSFLPKLNSFDAHLVNVFIEYEKNYPNLLNSTAKLLESNWEVYQRRQKERQAVERVDIEDMAKLFNNKERTILFGNSRYLQMTVGCTGGCSFCGVLAERGVKKAFSQDSLEKFWEGKLGKKIRIPHHRSEPFDWISSDGRYDYGYQVRLGMESIGKGKIFTSTSAPAGSELSIIRFLTFLYDKAEVVGKTSDGKYIELIKNFGGFRFSQKNENKKRISMIMQVLRDFGIPDSFLKQAIEIVDRERNEKQKGVILSKAINIGYLANNPDRDEYREVLGIANEDSLFMSPDGFTAESQEIVTKKNPQGLRIINQTPGNINIPIYQNRDNYLKVLDKKKNLFSLLPKHRYRTFKNGEFTGFKTIESVGRDALAFCLALDNLDEVHFWLTSKKAKKLHEKYPNLAFQMKEELEKNFIPQYEERKNRCKSLFAQETDEQAVRVATRVIGEIDDWLGHINERMGIES